MRGNEKQQGGMFSYVSMEERVPANHPLRPIRKLVDQILTTMWKRFDDLYAENGRPSIPPERLLRALLLQIFYTIRSERMLMEHLDYNLLFRWFVGLEMDEAVWNHAVFSKNRERLLNEAVARQFFGEVLKQAQRHLSKEHFTVDSTMIEAWAIQKASNARTAATMMPAAARTSMVRSGPMKRTHPRLIRMPGYIRSRVEAKRS